MHVAISQQMCGQSGLPGGARKRKTGDSAPAPADGRLLAPKKNVAEGPPEQPSDSNARGWSFFVDIRG